MYQQGKGTDDTIVIIGFEVNPSSRDYSPQVWDSFTPQQQQTQCPTTFGPLRFSHDFPNGAVRNAVWTYSVTWQLSDTPWDERWNVYFGNSSYQIHYISIAYSLIIVLILAGILNFFFLSFPLFFFSFDSN